ncbi:MAG: (d)CMP kinase [Verrucomicrobia bacterium]|nr:(d)CMP kinase [Verrucomicrobiota bacterium]
MKGQQAESTSPTPRKPRRRGRSKPIVVAIDGTSASGKSTNAKRVAKALNFRYVDTGAMYRTLAWYCLKRGVDIHAPKAVAAVCRKWKTRLVDADGQIRLLVDGYYPEREIRTAETSAAVPHVAAVPQVRQWMKRLQRRCAQFGNLVMEGRDIGTNVFPETEFKFYLDASLAERAKRREADGIREDLAQRDRRDSQRAAAPLMVPLGAVVIDTSGRTPEETSREILDRVRSKLETRRSDGTG